VAGLEADLAFSRRGQNMDGPHRGIGERGRPLLPHFLGP